MVVVEVALVVALHLTASTTYAIPFTALPEWFQATEPAVALVAIARLAALAIGYWLLTTTIIYGLAHQLGWSAVTDGMRWITLPVVRRVVHGVTAVSLTGFSIMGPAAVSVAPALAQTEAVVAQDGDDDSTGQLESEVDDGTPPPAYEPEAAGWPDMAPESDGFWIPEALTQADDVSAATHTVVKGDHLWSIAEDRLRSVVGRDVTEDEICQYWLKVIDANRGSLASGDPDLIYPDERVTLPPVFSE